MSIIAAPTGTALAAEGSRQMPSLLSVNVGMPKNVA